MSNILRIGDILVEHGAMERAHLEKFARAFHGRLGHALRMHGHVDGRKLSRAVAYQHGLPHVDLRETPPHTDFFSPRDLEHYIRFQFIPYARDVNAITLATVEPSEELRNFARTYYNSSIIHFVVITARELNEYFASRGATVATRNARHSLRRRYRHLVADRIMVGHQLRGLAILAIIVATITYLAPRGGWHALLILCNFFYAANLLIKLEFYRQGSIAQRQQAAADKLLQREVATIEDWTLPIYSILVPMYRERPEVMVRLIANLAALDYPKEKLDIKLILEADDHATLTALKALRPPETIEIIAVPPSTPRTKPKACNVALQHVRGDYIVIFDAEDHPAPDQLKRAIVEFRRSPHTLACLQASLNYYNRGENILTQMFSIEYSALFSLLLPALERMNLPIPLGGTSNHLKTSALRDVGGWDCFNVTEDADLGVRLAYLGYTTKTLPSVTLEEAPITLKAWMKQRTRWVKGYIQTWLVFTRDPKELKRRLGPTGYYGFQFFIGAPALTFLLAPLFWAVFILSLLGTFPNALSPWMQALCAFSFLSGTLTHWLFARKVMQIEGHAGFSRAFWFYPFYWLLHSFAAARALWQLITAPHYWDKTTHGVTKHRFAHKDEITG